MGIVREQWTIVREQWALLEKNGPLFNRKQWAIVKEQWALLENNGPLLENNGHCWRTMGIVTDGRIHTLPDAISAH